MFTTYFAQDMSGGGFLASKGTSAGAYLGDRKRVSSATSDTPLSGYGSYYGQERTTAFGGLASMVRYHGNEDKTGPKIGTISAYVLHREKEYETFSQQWHDGQVMFSITKRPDGLDGKLELHTAIGEAPSFVLSAPQIMYYLNEYGVEKN